MFRAFFDPLHVGHLDYLLAAKQLGDQLIVIVNNDAQAILKKGKTFMPAKERMRIIESLRCVDAALLSIDEDQTVRQTLAMIYQTYRRQSESNQRFIFANGGDVTEAAEDKWCRDLGIEPVYGVGGTEKIQSSSKLIEAARGAGV